MQRKYIEKEINKMASDFARKTEGKEIQTMRAFPCQKEKGQFVYIALTDKPELKDDGLWYLNGELLVSEVYKAKVFLAEERAKDAAARKAKAEQERNIKEMKPEVLGDGN